jgi:hypothetical protein
VPTRKVLLKSVAPSNEALTAAPLVDTVSAAQTCATINRFSRDIQQRSIIGEERRVGVLIKLTVDHPDIVSSMSVQ